MRKILLSLVLLTSLALACPFPSAHAQGPALGFLVIVNRTNPVGSLGRTEVSRMLMKQSARWPNGQAVQPVDLVGTSPAREAFSHRVHGRSATSVISFWRQQIFSGRGVPPPEQNSDADVVRFVASHAGGIGYVSPSANVSTVKVLAVTDL